MTVAGSTIGEEIAKAAERLRRAGIDTPRLDAEALLEHVLGVDRAYLIAHSNAPIEEESRDCFLDLVARRELREPLAYIVGWKEFWSLRLDVNAAVLIHRPETEILVEEAVSLLKGRPAAVADVGVGSGAVAIALAKELPEAKVYATESSPAAMEVAAANVAKHHVNDWVVLLAGDLLEPLAGALEAPLDAIVSNPPYIPSAELDKLQPEIARYEPREALDGGPDGLRFHRRILSEASRFLKTDGYVLIEIGSDQGDAVTGIARELGFVDIAIRKDLAGMDRVMKARASFGRGSRAESDGRRLEIPRVCLLDDNT